MKESEVSEPRIVVAFPRSTKIINGRSAKSFFSFFISACHTKREQKYDV